MQVSLRCTPSQLSAWEAAAAREHRTLAAWARLAIAVAPTTSAWLTSWVKGLSPQDVAPNHGRNSCSITIPIEQEHRAVIAVLTRRLDMSKSAAIRTALNAAARYSGYPASE